MVPKIILIFYCYVRAANLNQNACTTITWFLCKTSYARNHNLFGNLYAIFKRVAPFPMKSILVKSRLPMTKLQICLPLTFPSFLLTHVLNLKPIYFLILSVNSLFFLFISSFQLMRSLHTRSWGPDGIAATIFHCHDAHSSPITTIFNKSLAEGIFTSYWKCSYVPALFQFENQEIRQNNRSTNNVIREL